MKACLLNDLYQQCQSSKIQNLLKEKVPPSMALSEKITYLVHTVLKDFIAIGALNTKTFVFQNGPFGRVTEARLFESSSIYRLEAFKEQHEALLVSFEIVLLWPQQTCSAHCEPSMNSNAT